MSYNRAAEEEQANVRGGSSKSRKKALNLKGIYWKGNKTAGKCNLLTRFTVSPRELHIPFLQEEVKGLPSRTG
jgi:hypothetical protein